jgi:glycosyltransferase involved in cell wall biosynthesis
VRVVWDLTPLSEQATGIGRFLDQSFRAAVRVAPEHRFAALAFAGRTGARRLGEYLRTLPSEVEVRYRHAWGGAVWRALLNRSPAPVLERLAGAADAFVTSEWFYPPQRSGVRAAIVYDLVPLRFPEYSTRMTRRMHLAKLEDIQRADVVFCISTTTARDVEKTLGIDRARIRLARPGVDERFYEARRDGGRPAGDRPYVLAVGTIEPRKNLGMLLEAFALLRPRYPELTLVVAGPAGWGADPLAERAEALALGDSLVRTGYVPAPELPQLFAGAEVFCSTSLFEGFGMPIAEAMAAGVPVVASDHPSLDDVCGDAAIRVPAGDPKGIAEGLERVLDDPGTRGERVRRARAHVAAFTWDACARSIVTGIEEVSDRCGRSTN